MSGRIESLYNPKYLWELYCCTSCHQQILKLNPLTQLALQRAWNLSKQARRWLLELAHSFTNNLGPVGRGPEAGKILTGAGLGDPFWRLALALAVSLLFTGMHLSKELGMRDVDHSITQLMNRAARALFLPDRTPSTPLGYTVQDREGGTTFEFALDFGVVPVVSFASRGAIVNPESFPDHKPIWIPAAILGLEEGLRSRAWAELVGHLILTTAFQEFLQQHSPQIGHGEATLYSQYWAHVQQTYANRVIVEYLISRYEGRNSLLTEAVVRETHQGLTDMLFVQLAHMWFESQSAKDMNSLLNSFLATLGVDNTEDFSEETKQVLWELLAPRSQKAASESPEEAMKRLQEVSAALALLVLTGLVTRYMLGTSLEHRENAQRHQDPFVIVSDEQERDNVFRTSIQVGLIYALYQHSFIRDVPQFLRDLLDIVYPHQPDGTHSVQRDSVAEVINRLTENYGAQLQDLRELLFSMLANAPGIQLWYYDAKTDDFAQAISGFNYHDTLQLLQEMGVVPESLKQHEQMLRAANLANLARQAWYSQRLHHVLSKEGKPRVIPRLVDANALASYSAFVLASHRALRMGERLLRITPSALVPTLPWPRGVVHIMNDQVFNSIAPDSHIAFPIPPLNGMQL